MTLLSTTFLPPFKPFTIPFSILHDYIFILLFFLIEQTLLMQKQINQISLKIALNLLSDYIREKSSEVMIIHQKFAREFQSKAETDLHQWLITEIKKINFDVKNLMEGTRQYFREIQFGFVYQFFEKCCAIMEQNCKYLTQGLVEKTNKKIDIVRPPYVHSQLLPSVVVGTHEQEESEPKEEKIKRYSRQINKDLESLDYFLNLLSYEDSKTYEEYKSQCDKILLQREMLENIRPSQASKEIMETANMIQNVMESSDKVFQDSYMIKYMEFKSFVNDLQNPDQINDLFKEEMEKETKLKFKEGMNRTLLKCYEINKRQSLKNKISFATQTEETKGKFQQKLQNLLIIQKRNNQKLSAQIRFLKKNKSNVSDSLQLQKIIERQDQKQKQMENKYKILQALYSQKCEELQHPNEMVPAQRQSQLKNRVSTSIQTQNRKVTTSAQTDLDFYYYFQSNKIYDYKVKIIELEEILKHKEYIIQQMQAIRTFRDNFKSKKQVYSTAIRSARKMDKAKSLHYLDEDDQIYDLRNEQKNMQSSVDGTKKKVTLNEFDDPKENQKAKLSLSKKNKKKTQLFKNKPYFALNANVQDQPEEEPQKSECQLQKVSLKSILKLGNNQFKKDFGMQTEQTTDFIIQDLGKSKIERAKLNSRERSDRDKLAKSKLRSSETSSLFKEPREKTSANEQRPSFRKSNFVALQELNDRKQDKPLSNTMNSSSLRLSGFPSPKKLFPDKQKQLNMTRSSKWNEAKANTVGNEVLHVNNSLNFNFLVPINTTLKQTLSNLSLGKTKPKQETIKKMKMTSKML